MVAGVSNVLTTPLTRPIATVAALKKLTGASEDTIKKLHNIQPMHEVPKEISSIGDFVAEQLGVVAKLAIFAVADYMLGGSVLK